MQFPAMSHQPLHQVCTPELGSLKFKLKTRIPGRDDQDEEEIGLTAHFMQIKCPGSSPAFPFLLKEELKLVTSFHPRETHMLKCVVVWDMIPGKSWRLTIDHGSLKQLYLVKSKSVLLIEKRIGVGSAWGVSSAQLGSYAGIPVPATPP